jgi:hypothetical protein
MYAPVYGNCWIMFSCWRVSNLYWFASYSWLNCGGCVPLSFPYYHLYSHLIAATILMLSGSLYTYWYNFVLSFPLNSHLCKNAPPICDILVSMDMNVCTIINIFSYFLTLTLCSNASQVIMTELNFYFFQPIFQRYPRPAKEYQSFSLIYNDRSLDLVQISSNPFYF